MNDNAKGIFYASITASLWGFLAIALKIVVAEISPVSVVWFRFSTAFIILAVYTFFVSRRDFSIYRKPPILLILAAIFLGLNYLGFISGLSFISPASAQVFIQSGPLVFALSGIVIFREHVNWKHIAGFIIVVSGIALFYSEQISALNNEANNLLKGMLLVIGGGLSWAIFASLQKSLVRKYSPNQLNLFIYSFCMIMFLPFVRYSSIPDLGTGDWLILLFLGLNTVLAYGSLALAIKYTQATKVSVIVTMNPVITFTAMVILGRMQVSWIEPEVFTLAGIFGALMVIIGTTVVILAGSRK